MVDNNLLSTDACHNLDFIVLCRDLELLKEGVECISNQSWLILLDAMTNLVENNQLELPLHLCDSQILVHPITSCKQQLFGHSDI
jgi:hypothetical protein